MSKKKPVNNKIFIGNLLIVVIIIAFATYFLTPQPEEQLVIEVVGQPNVDLSITPNFDLEQYMGQWYEIARYDHKFERGCTCATANYYLKEDHVEVTNTCYKEGIASVAKAKGYTTDIPGYLEVQFFPLTKGEYRVIYVDKNYEYALVSDSKLEYFWMLSREPYGEADLNKLKKAAEERGINTFNLIYNEEC